MFIKKSCTCLLVLSTALLLAGCSAASKGIKLGDQAAAIGNYYGAALQYVNILRTEPKHAKSLMKLSEIAKPAYEQKLAMAEEYQKQGNLEASLKEYRELDEFVANLRLNNVLTFVTIDLGNAISTVSAGAAENHYSLAESQFARGDYERAIDEYKSVLDFKSPYKDSLEKISESYYRLAVSLEANHSYRASAETYIKSCSFTPGYKDAPRRATTLFLGLGDYFASKGNHRNACADYERAQSISPGLEGLSEKLTSAREHATTRIAFVRFDNPTGRNIAGMALGDIIFENAKSRLQAKASAFIKAIDREELLSIAQEQRIAEGSWNFETNTPIKIGGVDYLIFGKLNQVHDVHTGPRADRMAGEYDFWLDVPYTDKNGKQKTRTQWYKGAMTYDLITESIKLTLAGAVRVIEAKTGAVTISHQISEETADNIQYAMSFSARHNLNAPNVQLDDQIKTLISGRRQLVDLGELAERMIASISTAMADRIVATLDRTPSVSDPISLKY